jgi:hypothetical protein
MPGKAGSLLQAVRDFEARHGWKTRRDPKPEAGSPVASLVLHGGIPGGEGVGAGGGIGPDGGFGLGGFGRGLVGVGVGSVGPGTGFGGSANPMASMTHPSSKNLKDGRAILSLRSTRGTLLPRWASVSLSILMAADWGGTVCSDFPARRHLVLQEGASSLAHVDAAAPAISRQTDAHRRHSSAATSVLLAG